MPRRDYNWKRFWYDRGGSLTFHDAGYLYDPDSRYGHIVSKDVSSMETIKHLPCLVLLGDPGTGKSHAMQAAREAEHRSGAKGTSSLFLDLRSYGDEGRLVDDLFKSPVWTSWLDGKDRLIVYLDSLDECS